jgi:hypothetical protein
VATGILGSAVSYFFGADFWASLENRVGLGAEPVEVQVTSDVDQFESEAVHVPEFVVPRPLAAIGPPPSGDRQDGRYAWAHAMGGVDARQTVLRVTVTGNSSSSVVLQGLRFSVTARRAPLTGTHITYTGLGDAIGARFVDVDLDASPPKSGFIGGRGEPEKRFPLRVNSAEVEVFDISANTATCDCSWVAELSYSAEGEQGSVTIDGGGQPFRTTAVPDRVEPSYWDRGRWRTFGGVDG